MSDSILRDYENTAGQCVHGTAFGNSSVAGNGVNQLKITLN